MLESPRCRAVGVVVLLAVLLGLGVWFGALSPAPSAGAFPRSEDLAGEYAEHHGEQVVVAGTVVATDPVVLRADDGAGGTVSYSVEGVDRPVSVGDGLWVAAVVAPGRTLRATGAVVLPPANVAYARGISLLAGVWVLGRILRDWRLDRVAVGLVPRDAEPGDSGGEPDGGDRGG